MSGKNERYYQFRELEFKQLTGRWLNQKVTWKKRMVVVWLLLIAVVLVFAFCIYGIGGPTNYEDDMVNFVAVMVGALFALAPGIVAFFLYFHGKRKIGSPFTHMSKMFLFTNYSGLQFGYRDTANEKEELVPGGRMTVWQIAYGNIKWVNINPKYKMVTVIGRTEMVGYADITSERIDGEFTSGQFGEFGTISFFDCFNDREEFIRVMEENGVEIRYSETLIDTENTEQFLTYLSQNGVQVRR